MSGHSHYATIKRQKAASDAAKGNVFSKHAKAIMLAAKGGADPDLNFKLRVAIDKAREDNMPKENIERAISRAVGEGGSLEEVVYEGFGPKGLFVIVEVATDNKNRSAQEIKNLFEKSGGRLGGPGSVAYNFDQKGYLLIKKNENPDNQVLQLIDMGVEDVEVVEEGIEVYVSPEMLSEIRKKVLEAGLEINRLELQMIAKNILEPMSPADQQKITYFLDALENHDDVQKVSSNF